MILTLINDNKKCHSSLSHSSLPSHSFMAAGMGQSVWTKKMAETSVWETLKVYLWSLCVFVDSVLAVELFLWCPSVIWRMVEISFHVVILCVNGFWQYTEGLRGRPTVYIPAGISLSLTDRPLDFWNLWHLFFFWEFRFMVTKYCTFCVFWACVPNVFFFSSVSAVKPSKTYSRGSVVMVDEMINSSPPHYRFPEAGLRVMITNHFGPKTRLRMASRLIINEVRKLTCWVNISEKIS